MKKNITSTKLFLSIIIITGIYACKDVPETALKYNLDLPSTPFDYSKIKLGGQFIDIKERLNDETVEVYNDHTATLGRVLFYEKALSVNNSVSCGSCHQQSKGFTDGLKHSVGFAGKLTPRNTPQVYNTFRSGSLFWDARATTAVDLSLEPVFNHLEMGIENDEILLAKVKNKPYYEELFNNAYGSSEITKEKIALALGSFMNSIGSDDLMGFISTPEWEEKYKGNQLVNMGRELYFSSKTNCVTCHSVNLTGSGIYYGGRSTVRNTSNIGLDVKYSDEGAGNGNFRIPNLMNVSLTAPYMHDGRYNTLEEVVEHYNSGVKNHPNLDPLFLKNGKVIKLNLTSLEKKALIKFMETLITIHVMEDEKYSDPFVAN
jgi:cytochrome c peroxidase